MVRKNLSEKDLTLKDEKIHLLLSDLNSLESYINDIFTFSPLPISFVSPLGVILESNPAFVKISGFTFDEIVGKSIEEFFELEGIKKIIKEIEKKGFVEGKEIDFFPKTKKEVPCQIFARVRKDSGGKNLGYFLSIVNLTEIKKTQREARRALMNILEDVQEERNKAEEEKNKTLAIITNFADGVLVFDRNNNLLLINPKAEQFFRVNAKDIILKPISKLSRISSLTSLVKLYKKRTKGIFREELEIEENLILEVSIVPVVKGKEAAGSLVILHNVTREKLIEKMKSEFVSLAAHQLRTPLSAVKWILKTVLDGELGELKKEQKEFLEDGYVSNQRMINLVNDLLNVARIEEGRYIYDLVLTDFKELVKPTIYYFRKECRKKKIKFLFKKTVKKIPKVLIDAEKMIIVLENIIDNAARYTFPGGKVEISLDCTAKEISFCVKDNGMGIPKNQQKNVFKKFFRGANVVRKETDGTGLGLFISKNIIEAHKGKIWFESEENKGTKVCFTIPIKKGKI
ncbi:hypothetical protein AMJ47_03760 [Parcubacteria bacterium DG_72]|nr:MAG: hypothetical protein AMJ47_03760 [Parcubacteria bacterium DG_72]